VELRWRAVTTREATAMSVLSHAPVSPAKKIDMEIWFNTFLIPDIPLPPFY
jgi:hypothetical protein